MELRQDDVVLSLSRREERLLVYLAIAAHPSDRTRVAGELWPLTTQARAMMSLRAALAILRRLPLHPVIMQDHGRLRLHIGVEVDWWTAVDAAELLLADDAGRPGDDPIALLRYGLLVDWTDEWIRDEQRAFDELRVHALEAYCKQQLAVGSFGVAIRAAMIAVSADPLRESAYAALIAAHLAEGNRVAATRAYARLTELLDEELGVEPSFTLSMVPPHGAHDATGARHVAS